MTRPLHAVIPAAGRGTRLAPLTDEKPKPLVDVGGRPLIEHVFDALAPVDPDSYVLVIGYRGDQIRDHLGDTYDNTPIEYVHQPEPEGLADAVRRAGRAVQGDRFVVCNGDNVLQGGLAHLVAPIRENSTTAPAATMLLERTTHEEARETGVVVTNDRGEVRRVVEKPDDPPNTLVSAGAYAFTPAIVEACEAIEPASTGEYELADAINLLLDRGHRVETAEIEGERVNVNDHDDLERAATLIDSD